MKVSADLSTTTDTPDNRSTSNEGGGVAEVEAKAKVEPALNRHAGHRKKTRTPTYTDQCFTYGRRRKNNMSIHHRKQGRCWLRAYRRAAQSVKKSLARLSTRGVSSVSVLRNRNRGTSAALDSLIESEVPEFLRNIERSQHS